MLGSRRCPNNVDQNFGDVTTNLARLRISLSRKELLEKISTVGSFFGISILYLDH